MDINVLLNLLGFPPDSKLCIISCDNLGFAHSFNQAIFDSLRKRTSSCARIIIGAPWAREVISQYRGEDIGVALTFISNHPIFRIAPLTQSPTLVDGAGELPASRKEFWAHADTDEVRRECRAQLERAIYYGFDPSHISSEGSALTLRPEFFDVMLDIALEFNLPIKIPDGVDAGFPANEIAWAEGVISPTNKVIDFDANPTNSKSIIYAVEEAISNLQTGVSELSFRPSLPSDELNALAGEKADFYVESQYLLDSIEFKQLLMDYSIRIIGYRELKFVQSELADRNESDR